MKETDRLALREISCQCHIGVTEEERRRKQRIEVDLELTLSLEAAAKSGDLAAAVDYQIVCDSVRGYMEGGEFHLIEAAGGGILDLVLERFPVQSALVRIRKFVLPRVGCVEVQMERHRER